MENLKLGLLSHKTLLTMKINCKNYTVYINDWSSLQLYIQSSKASKVLVIVDGNTKTHCLPILKQHVSGVELHAIEIHSGELHKNLATCNHIWNKILEFGADRHSLCINLGGGVIGDMGGFAAATYMRGMDFIQLPTTLLSQVDASVGGKLGVDYEGYKNLIGIIKDPGAVFMFTEFLETLPQRQLLSGFAELIKHGLIVNKQVYNELSEIRSLESVDWAPIVYESVDIKKTVTEQDPQERGLRKILNFGHTLGHAIESVNLETDSPLLHGEAIAIGMIMEAHLSMSIGNITLDECDEIKSYITGLYGHHPDKIPSIETLTSLMKKDKKNRDGNIKFSLLSSVGDACYDQEVSKLFIEKALDFYKY